MNPKASAALEKACEDRRRSNFKKALSRLEEGIEKFPKELTIYTEAIDVGMEAGESLKTIQIFKRSQRELPDDAFELWTFTVEKVGVYNDPIVGRFLLEQAVRGGEFSAAHSILQNLTDHAAGELLDRIKTKKQTMSVAMGTRLAARDDVVFYTLGEALLLLRLGRLLEAADGFARALDENPGLFKRLEPYLADVEKQHGDKGEASYALGYCYIAGGRYSKAVESLVRAAKRAPFLCPRVIEKIESLGDHPDLPADIRHLRLAELYLGAGDVRRASDLLTAILDRNAGMADEIADFLRPAAENIGEDLGIHFVFVEASCVAGRRDTALAQLRKIHRCREHKARLVEWLESNSRSERLSNEIRLFFAETALTEGLYGKAIEIFKDMLSHGTQEQATIKELLSRHQSTPLIQHFYNERFGASLMREKDTACEFERYDDLGLAPPKVEPSSPNRPGEQGTPIDDTQQGHTTRLEMDNALPGVTASCPPGGKEASRPDFENRDFSLSMHAPADPSAGETSFEISQPSFGQAKDSDLFEYLKRDFSPDDRAARDTSRLDLSETPADLVPPPEEESADRASPDAGGAPGETAGPSPASSEESLERLTEETGGEMGGQDQPTELPEDFDSLYRAFLDGALDRGRILEVVEKAYDEDRMTEMKRLLAFEPANLGEEIARKFQLARYYLATDRPLSALVALKTIQPGALSKEERKTFLLRTADCYRGLHNYEAAHAVYLRIMSDHPGDSDIEAAARTNYARYIAAAAGAAPALEKLTNL